jgi:hypothetical protein
MIEEIKYAARAICVCGTLSLIFILWALAMSSCQNDKDPTAHSPEPEPTVTHPVGPACIHQKCAESLTTLTCRYWVGSTCSMWNANYEIHCECDQWETPSK